MFVAKGNGSAHEAQWDGWLILSVSATPTKMASNTQGVEYLVLNLVYEMEELVFEREMVGSSHEMIFAHMVSSVRVGFNDGGFSN